MPAAAVAAVVGFGMSAAGASLVAVAVTTAVVGGVVAAIRHEDILQGALGGALAGVAAGGLAAGLSGMAAGAEGTTTAATGAVEAATSSVPTTTSMYTSLPLSETAPAINITEGAVAGAAPAAASATPSSFMTGVKSFFQPVLQSTGLSSNQTQALSGNQLPVSSINGGSQTSGSFWGGMSPAEKMMTMATIGKAFVPDNGQGDNYEAQANLTNAQANKLNNFGVGTGDVGNRIQIASTPQLLSTANPNTSFLKQV